MAEAEATPPVTLALLAFNQERFIEEGVQGALSQDYPNLEIILSDDGSSDRTYELICSARDRYRGPHRVIANRTPRNAGTLAHVENLYRQSRGELLVLAAGDDISYPHRVSRLVDHWRRTGADALCSKYDVIDDEGKLIERDYVFPTDRFEFRDYFPEQEVVAIHGASSAYARRFLDTVEFPLRPILFEDTFFTLTIHRRGGRVHFIDEALVKYRRHGASSTNADYRLSDEETVRTREIAAQRIAASVADVLITFEESLRRSGSSATVDTGKLVSDLGFFRHRAAWTGASPRERFGALLRTRRRNHAAWAAARLFGMRGLLRIKALQGALRRLPAGGRRRGA